MSVICSCLPFVFSGTILTYIFLLAFVFSLLYQILRY